MRAATDFVGDCGGCGGWCCIELAGMRTCTHIQRYTMHMPTCCFESMIDLAWQVVSTTTQAEWTHDEELPREQSSNYGTRTTSTTMSLASLFLSLSLSLSE